MYRKVQPEGFFLLVTMPISYLRFLFRRSKKSRGRARGEKEKGPPLPFACFPRVACKKIVTGAFYTGYRIFSIKRRPRLNAGAFVQGPGVYLRRVNKYRYSLEKHCYDKYCTVYTAFVILIDA